MNCYLCKSKKKMYSTHYAYYMQCTLNTLRDWSVITWRGGYKMGKSRVRNFLHPPSQQDKTFRAPFLKSGNLLRPPFLKSGNLLRPPFLKSGNFLRPPFNMAKTSSYCIETTSKLFVPPPPPFSMAETLSVPLFAGIKLNMPSRSSICTPHPFPVISYQTLKYLYLQY